MNNVGFIAPDGRRHRLGLTQVGTPFTGERVRRAAPLPPNCTPTSSSFAAALWFTYRYFTEVWPNREKVYVPEPWKGD